MNDEITEQRSMGRPLSYRTIPASLGLMTIWIQTSIPSRNHHALADSCECNALLTVHKNQPGCQELTAQSQCNSKHKEVEPRGQRLAGRHRDKQQQQENVHAKAEPEYKMQGGEGERAGLHRLLKGSVANSQKRGKTIPHPFIKSMHPSGHFLLHLEIQAASFLGNSKVRTYARKPRDSPRRPGTEAGWRCRWDSDPSS